ncbi:hypothetical protein AB0E69_21665 [Kribbella sp. NPDC026611]|uniref:hypothetical protein n=1 Tax=Kribbella sp. NPDC026611 TaxID=3154911 RepID=UPI0033D6F07A
MNAQPLFVNFTCSSTRHPGVARFEWKAEQWQLVGASRQRPDSSPVAAERQSQSGGFVRGPAYTGCPSCGADSFVQCGRCQSLGCWDNSWPDFTCPTCGNRGEVSDGTIESISTTGSS